MDPFRTHLVAILSLCEVASSANAPFPEYTGPRDSQTNAILKSIGNIAQRMWVAEARGRGEVPEAPTENLFITDENLTSLEQPKDIPSVDQHPNTPSVALETNKPTMSTSLNDTEFDPASSNVGCPSPFVIPLPIPASSFEDMSPIEELRLLKAQVADIARVCNAVFHGDLAQKVTVPVRGVVMIQLKDVTNSMVDKLRDFTTGLKWALEYNELICDCPTDRKPIADVVEGTWFELSNAADKLSSTLHHQTRIIGNIAQEVALGNLSTRIDDTYKQEARGERLDMCMAINGMVTWLQMFMDEATRATSEVVSLGNVDDEGMLPELHGEWLTLLRNIKSVCSVLKKQSQLSNSSGVKDVGGDA